MSKEDILLRNLVNPPLVTKGSALTFDEFDGNWVEIFNAFVELSQSSNVDAYSAAITYVTNSYVMNANQLWKMISATSQINITPGTNPAIWKPVFASDLVVSPSSVIQQFEVRVPTAEVLTMNATPIDLVPAQGPGIAIQVLSGSITVDFDIGSPGGTPYDTNTNISIGLDTLVPPKIGFQVADILKATIEQTLPFTVLNPTYSASVDQLKPDHKLVALVQSGDPLNGDSDIIIRGQYILINV